MSPIVAPNFLLKYIANTSVPSMTAPPLMESPIPAPRKKPPNNATNKLSFVMLGNSTVATTNASPVIARAVLIANVRPIVKYPIIINGIFTTINTKYSGMIVNADIKREIPVATPSIK